jgi:hypothetical protein
MQVVEAERAESSRALAHQNLRVVNARVGFQDRQLAAMLQDTSEVADRSRTAIAAWFRRLPKSVRLAKCVTVCRTVPSPAAVIYQGIHFAFLASGSMSFLGMNLIQPSLFISFFSGTWPM